MPLRHRVERAVDWLAIVTFSGMFACVLVQVFFRYFLDSPLTWSDELARYLFVWCAFLGWVIAARRRSHLAISAVQVRLPPRARAALGVVAALAAVVFAGILCHYGVRITLRNADVETPSLFFTMGVVYAIVPAAAVAVGLHALGDLVAAARAFRGLPEAPR
ncbi:MAG: TRAP transporter small permease [Betaproteobacteria bacterium]|nr:TRAP transporter small permease [Betaproteobacteria bacterium]MBK9676670.1 TRAP transporter small permease [Betaproteobacteria bacterium]